ncbi:MAG: PKD domain-containing protein [Myxococcales bacterium]
MTRRIGGRAALALAALAGAASALAGDWRYYRYDAAGTANPGEALTEVQAQGFHPLWTSPTPPIADPVVAGGTVYVVDGDNLKLDALDAATGQVIWSRSAAATATVSCVGQTVTEGAIGAPALVGSTLVFPGPDGDVYGLDASTGAVLWQTPVADPAQDEFFWSSAFPANGLVYVGIATYFENACGEVPGRLVALNPATGAAVATWWSSSDHGPGGTLWSRQSYDPTTNRLFLSTGTGVPDPTAANQPLAQSIVAVDASTLQTLDSFTISAPYEDDYDFGGSPCLFDLPNGTPLVAAINKDGVVYALNRNDLASGPVWTYTVGLPGASPDSGQGSIVSPAYGNGLLFVGGGQTADGYPGAVAALDPATGAPKWVFHPAGYVLASLTAAGDVVIAGATDPATGQGTLYVLAQSTGVVLYQQATATPIWAEATYSNGVLYFGDEQGWLYALAPGAGTGGGSSGGTGGSSSGGTSSGGSSSSGGGQGQEPVAVISGGPFSGAAPLDVYLDATSSYTRSSGGWIQAFSWDLGDGTTTTDAYFTHTYASPGNYTVTLTATDGDGVTSTATQVIQATSGGSSGGGSTGGGSDGGQGPVAVISGGPFSGAAPLAVYLDATSSYTQSAGGWIQAFSWDLGDGTTTSDAYFTHTYANPGNYTVTLTATDGDGVTSTVTQVIQATGGSSSGGGSSGGGSDGGQGPVAVISGGPFSGAAPLAVYLDATSSHTQSSGGWIQAFSWDLGDGTTTTDGYFTHTYASPGDYTVTLTVTDGDGVTNATTVQLAVQ